MSDKYLLAGSDIETLLNFGNFHFCPAKTTAKTDIVSTSIVALGGPPVTHLVDALFASLVQ